MSSDYPQVPGPVPQSTTQAITQWSKYHARLNTISVFEHYVDSLVPTTSTLNLNPQPTLYNTHGINISKSKSKVQV